MTAARMGGVCVCVCLVPELLGAWAVCGVCVLGTRAG